MTSTPAEMPLEDLGYPNKDTPGNCSEEQAASSSSHTSVEQSSLKHSVGLCPHSEAAYSLVSGGASRNIELPAHQLYRVPQLHNVPKRRTQASEMFAVPHIPASSFFQTSEHLSNQILMPPKHDINYTPFPVFHDSTSKSFTHGSQQSSSLASFRGSPLTPWSATQPFPIEPRPVMGHGLCATADSFKMSELKLASELVGDIHEEQQKQSPGSATSFQPDLREANEGVPLSPLEIYSPLPAEGISGLGIEGFPLGNSSSTLGHGYDVTDRETSQRHYISTSPVNIIDFAASPERINALCASQAPFSPSTCQSTIGCSSPDTKATDHESISSGLTADKLPAGDYEYKDIDPKYFIGVPVWREQRQGSSRFTLDHYEEVFSGAFDVLSTINPDHYQMAFGSRLVCIKANSVTNMLLSVRTGTWACPEPVTKRIKALFDSRDPDRENILFLFSIPGSKHFSGLAELRDISDDTVTDFWSDGSIFKGSMVLRWLYCKVVPYEYVRRAVAKTGEEESATQMWNGMHYSEPVGRQVVKAYVEHPHVDNILARPLDPKAANKLTPKRGNFGGGRGRRGRGFMQSRSESHGGVSVRGQLNAPWDHEQKDATPRLERLGQRALTLGRNMQSSPATPTEPMSAKTEDGKPRHMSRFFPNDGSATPTKWVANSNENFFATRDDATRTAPLSVTGSNPFGEFGPSGFSPSPRSSSRFSRFAEWRKTIMAPSEAITPGNKQVASQGMNFGTPTSSPRPESRPDSQRMSDCTHRATPIAPPQTPIAGYGTVDSAVSASPYWSTTANTGQLSQSDTSRMRKSSLCASSQTVNLINRRILASEQTQSRFMGVSSSSEHSATSPIVVKPAWLSFPPPEAIEGSSAPKARAVSNQGFDSKQMQPLVTQTFPTISPSQRALYPGKPGAFTFPPKSPFTGRAGHEKTKCSPDSSQKPGRGGQAHKGQSSMDMTNRSWVDRLLASPSLEGKKYECNEKSESPFGSLNSLADD